MRTRNRAPQEKMPDEELSRRILFYGHLANLCAYGCIAGAVLGVLAGILLQSFTAGCTIVMLVIVAAVFFDPADPHHAKFPDPRSAGGWFYGRTAQGLWPAAGAQAVAHER